MSKKSLMLAALIAVAVVVGLIGFKFVAPKLGLGTST